jgi:hypothetical protein
VTPSANYNEIGFPVIGLSDECPGRGIRFGAGADTPRWKDRADPFTNLLCQIRRLGELVFRPLVRTPNSLRKVPRRGVLNFFLDWHWDKDICHGHDKRLNVGAHSGALQIFKRCISAFRTVVANKYLHWFYPPRPS